MNGDDLCRCGHIRSQHGDDGQCSVDDPWYGGVLPCWCIRFTADAAADACDCDAALVTTARTIGVEITATPVRPDPTGYDANPMTCPHGTTWYQQPTAEQVEAWRRDGVA